jgi:hypothetical protein
MEMVAYVLGLALLAFGCLLGIASLVLGLPGTFIIVLVALTYGWATGFALIQLSTLAWLLGLAVLGEAIELASSVGAGGQRPSTRVAVAAVAGGIVGGIVGAPILFGLGALPGALIGAFAGAALAVASEGGARSDAVSAGLAAMRGRLLGFVLKTAIAVVMVILIVAAVL